MLRILAITCGLAALTATAAAAPEQRIRTLVEVKARVTAFGQDGRFVAWATTERPRRSGCGTTVRVRNVKLRSERLLTRRDSGATCRSVAPVSRLALAGDGQVLWARFETGNFYYRWLSTGSFANARERELGLVSELAGDDLRVSLAGDGEFLGYGWSHAGSGDCVDEPCSYEVRGGGVVRLVHAGGSVKAVTLDDVPPTALLAVAGGRLAILVRGARGATTSPRPDLRVIEVRNSSTGALESRITASASVRGLAMSQSAVAALTLDAVGVYSLDGQRITRQPVPRMATDIALVGRRVVYRVGNRIFLTGSVRAIAAGDPIGLSVDGNRVAWAENVRSGGRIHGRIRAVTLP